MTTVIQVVHFADAIRPGNFVSGNDKATYLIHCSTVPDVVCIHCSLQLSLDDAVLLVIDATVKLVEIGMNIYEYIYLEFYIVIYIALYDACMRSTRRGRCVLLV